jgi:hypothetical protein
MKTIFDAATRNELIARISSLNENCTAQWGKMNVYQMVKHCIAFEEMALGKKKYKRKLLGYLFGKMALRNIIKDGPLVRNTPTLPELRIKENGNVLDQKAKWIALIEEYDHFSNHNFIHPFFGKMTKEQIGYMAYKHTDHHLRQFKS